MKNTQILLEEAVLPQQYSNYVFDLYGTLVDIHTEENDPALWQKLALFYGYYDASNGWIRSNQTDKDIEP